MLCFTFPCGVPGQVWYLIVSIPDLCIPLYFYLPYLQKKRRYVLGTTVLPAKSDSDVMFVYRVIRDLESIDHLCINHNHRIGLIHK